MINETGTTKIRQPNSVREYPIPWPPQLFTLEMPEGAKVLTCQLQDNVPYLWAAVDVSLPRRIRTFRAVRTGEPLGDGSYAYVGTWPWQENGGALVFHLFEVV